MHITTTETCNTPKTYQKTFGIRHTTRASPQPWAMDNCGVYLVNFKRTLNKPSSLAIYWVAMSLTRSWRVRTYTQSQAAINERLTAIDKKMHVVCTLAVLTPDATLSQILSKHRTWEEYLSLRRRNVTNDKPARNMSGIHCHAEKFTSNYTAQRTSSLASCRSFSSPNSDT